MASKYRRFGAKMPSDSQKLLEPGIEYSSRSRSGDNFEVFFSERLLIGCLLVTSTVTFVILLYVAARLITRL